MYNVFNLFIISLQYLHLFQLLNVDVFVLLKYTLKEKIDIF